MTKEKLSEASWPRNKVVSVECRKKDLVIRIANWLRDRDEPAFDVECYIAGVYDWNESRTFTTKSSNRSPREARKLAVEFAQAQVAKLIGGVR